MSDIVVERQHEGRIAIVRLNRPERRNALSLGHFVQLAHEFRSIGEDREVRVVVLAGAGAGFCAGLDLADPGALSGVSSLPLAQRMLLNQEAVVDVIPAMRDLPQPIIAAVHGAAVGAGFAFTLAADIRIAAMSAFFQNAFLNVGLSGCDFGVSYLLPRLIGASAAAEIMLTAERVPAVRAAELGLVSRVVPDVDLEHTAIEIARQVASKSPFGVAQTKRVLTTNLAAADLRTAQQLENRTQVAAIIGGDFEEAVAAFIERRPPAFSVLAGDRP